MKPSQSSIERAIDLLKASPGNFQRLVEDYAEISYPHLFDHLAPLGRQAGGTTVKGWPDATALLPSGRKWALLEATHSANWVAHLEKDIQRLALESESVGVFMFVAWAKSPPRDQLQKYRERIVALGVPIDRIFLVFREQFVRDIAHPRFVRQWVDPLHLPVSSLPFELIDEAHQLFGAERLGSSFVPSRSEYIGGLVHRPGLADFVEQRLTTDGWALVRGIGAAGKTVLATLIALGQSFALRPSYYLSLGGWSRELNDPASAIESLTTCGDDGVLFILDDVHLDSKTARQIFDAWREFSDGSRLLLLGRLVTPDPDHRGRTHPFADLEDRVMELRVTSADLRGVYRRLIRRRTKLRIPDPPARAVEDWTLLFSGDLLAFSSAVAQRSLDLARGVWQLQPADAERYIKREYLDGMDAVALSVLRRLAILAELEVSASALCLAGAPIPARALETGLVLRTNSGENSDPLFRLVHPGMGTLILASLPPEGHGDIVLQMAVQDSLIGCRIADQLRALGRTEEARSVLRAIADSSTWFSSAFLPPALLTTSKLFADFEVLSFSAMDARLAPHQTEIVTGAYSISLSLLFRLLLFTRQRLPLTHKAITDAMAAPASMAALRHLAAQEPLSSLTAFVRFLQQEWPSLCSSLDAALSVGVGIAHLVDQAGRSLSRLREFLSVALNTLPGTLEKLAEALSSPQNSYLLLVAGPKNFHQVAGFVAFLRTDAPRLYRELMASITQPGHVEGLSEMILRSPPNMIVYALRFLRPEPDLLALYEAVTTTMLDPEIIALIVSKSEDDFSGIAGLFAFAQEHLPALSAELASSFSEEGSLVRLAEAAATKPLEDLAGFLQHVPVAPAALRLITEANWDEHIVSRTAPGLHAVSRVIERLMAFERPDLARSCSRAALMATAAADWNRRDVSLSALSQVLRVAVDFEAEAVDQFLDLVATPLWLQERYRTGGVGGLASAIFSLWASLDKTSLLRFATLDLQRELRARLAGVLPNEPADIADQVRLIGSGSLLGLRLAVGPLAMSLFDSRQIERAVAALAPRLRANRLGLNQVQLWLGLREIARTRQVSYRLPAKAGRTALALLRRNSPEHTKVSQLFGIITTWLQRCEAEGWRLVRDDTPPPI